MIINKDESINCLLKNINLKEHGWKVVDHWDGDQCAIGIANTKKPRYLVYISTFGKDKGRYDYECETPTGSEPTEYITSEKGEDVNFDEILIALQKHLK